MRHRFCNATGPEFLSIEEAERAITKHQDHGCTKLAVAMDYVCGGDSISPDNHDE